MKLKFTPTVKGGISNWQQYLLPSMMGLASRICCSIQECCPDTAARNCRISLVLSVLPAPDSPLKSHTRVYKTCKISLCLLAYINCTLLFISYNHQLHSHFYKCNYSQQTPHLNLTHTYQTIFSIHGFLICSSQIQLELRVEFKWMISIGVQL